MKFEDRLPAGSYTLKKLESEHRIDLLNFMIDQSMWIYTPSFVSNEKELTQYIDKAILKREAGEQWPYVVIDNLSGKIIGTNRFYKIDRKNKTVSIGYICIDKDYRRKGISTVLSKEMSNHALSIGFQRVMMSIHSENIASRRSAEKAGFVLEGVMKKHMILHGGRIRDTAIYARVS